MSTLEIIACNFKYNEAKVDGGAIYNSPKLGVFNSPKYIIKDNTTFIGNKALYSGGAICASGFGSIIYIEHVL